MKFGLAAVGKYNKRGDNWRSDTEDRALSTASWAYAMEIISRHMKKHFQF